MQVCTSWVLPHGWVCLNTGVGGATPSLSLNPSWHIYAGSKDESHYTVWTAWISIRVRVRVRVAFILQKFGAPGTTVHVPTAL